MALNEDITAWSTLAAVVVALGIAWSGNRRSDRQTTEERKRADRQLREERERSDRERRIERNVALLVEAYDLYAEYKPTVGGQRDDAALFKLHTRLAALPWTVATLIRFDISDELLPVPEGKKAWVAHRAGQPDVQVGAVGFGLLKHEFPADLWFLRHDQPFEERQPWWFAYDQEHPSISGNVSPGILPQRP